MATLRHRSAGTVGSTATCGDRATPTLQEICCENIRGCSYREGDARALPLRPDAERVPEGNEIPKNTRLVSSSR
jgi:hypothetical protein